MQQEPEQEFVIELLMFFHMAEPVLAGPAEYEALRLKYRRQRYA